VDADDFPLLWDADFFFGDPPGPDFLRCKISGSCVAPFPDGAITPFIEDAARRFAGLSE
jgi:hypothetical protein